MSPQPCQNRKVPITLLAREHFKRGDYGYAEADGVYRLRSGACPIDALVVIALRDVRPFEHGEFEEAQPASELIH